MYFLKNISQIPASVRILKGETYSLLSPTPFTGSFDKFKRKYDQNQNLSLSLKTRVDWNKKSTSVIEAPL